MTKVYLFISTLLLIAALFASATALPTAQTASLNWNKCTNPQNCPDVNWSS